MCMQITTLACSVFKQIGFVKWLHRHVMQSNHAHASTVALQIHNSPCPSLASPLPPSALAFSRPIHVNSLTGRMQAVVGRSGLLLLPSFLPSRSVRPSARPPCLLPAAMPRMHRSIGRGRWPHRSPSTTTTTRTSSGTGRETTLFEAHGVYQCYLGKNGDIRDMSCGRFRMH